MDEFGINIDRCTDVATSHFRLGTLQRYSKFRLASRSRRFGHRSFGRSRSFNLKTSKASKACAARPAQLERATRLFELTQPLRFSFHRTPRRVIQVGSTACGSASFSFANQAGNSSADAEDRDSRWIVRRPSLRATLANQTGATKSGTSCGAAGSAGWAGWSVSTQPNRNIVPCRLSRLGFRIILQPIRCTLRIRNGSSSTGSTGSACISFNQSGVPCVSRMGAPSTG